MSGLPRPDERPAATHTDWSREEMKLLETEVQHEVIRWMTSIRTL